MNKAVTRCVALAFVSAIALGAAAPREDIFDEQAEPARVQVCESDCVLDLTELFLAVHHHYELALAAERRRNNEPEEQAMLSAEELDEHRAQGVLGSALESTPV